MLKVIARAVVLLAVLGVPAEALAQLSIAGLVRDTSGAVLPGVSVEASSPVLIEKVRTVVTDGSGQYQIVNLLPGTYTVSFTLAGFNTVRREGVELSGNTFVAAINAELRVGALEETVTVKAEAPTVDLQNVIQQQTMNSDLLASIPSARQFFTEAQLVPGVTLTNMPSGIDVGGTAGVPQAAVLDHGSKTNDFRLNVDGLSVGTGGAGFTMWMPNPSQTDEISFTLSGGLGESETAGAVINMVPKSGGNKFTGSVHFSGTSSTFQGSNSDDALVALGFSNPNRIKRMYDLDPGFGGPLMKDHLWFYGTYHDYNTQNWVANTFTNLNAGNVNSWTYSPNLNDPAFLSDRYQAGSMRLTWQPTPRNKFAAYWDEQYRCESCAGANAGGPGASGVAVSPFRSPEATAAGRSWPDRVQQATWSSPVNNRLLLQAGIGTQNEWETTQPREDGTANPALVSVMDQGGTYPGIIYRSPDQYRAHWGGSLSWKGSASYVTGTHNAKFGYFGQWNYRTAQDVYQQSLAYRFNNGVPNQLTQYASPYFIDYTTNLAGLYAQDSITFNRITLQGGVRYDKLNTSWPDQTAGPTGITNVQGQPTFIMPQTISFPAGQGLHFNDITPRMSVAYDLFGNGKTALKFAVGKYSQLVAVGPGGGGAYELSPLGRLNFQTNRSWADANKNFVPDCNLALPGANGECGPLANQNFGLGAPFSSSLDPDVAGGWGNRPYQWQMSAVWQQQLLARTSLDVGFYRRTFGNFGITDNVAVSASDYSSFNLTVPSSSQLPGGGGQTLTFLDLNPNKFGQTNNVLRLDSNFGGITEHFNGLDINLNMRPRNGLTMQAGVDAGTTSYNVCNAAQQVPEILFGLQLVDTISAGGGQTPIQYCAQSTGIRTQVKGLASYTIPKVDLQVAGTFQRIPGAMIPAVFNAPNATIAPSLGRSLSGNAANAALNLAEPGQQFGDTIHQLDLRVAKVVRFGGAKTLVGVDLYNVTNTNTIQSYVTTFGSAYLHPTLIMPPRFVKFSVQLDF